MKTIITFCSIWAFLGYKWAKNFPALVSFFILFDIFLTLNYFWINRIPWSIGLAESFEKKIIKKIEYSRNLSDPENYWCGHQQPYNFFPIFGHFQITQENQNQLIWSEKIAVTGEKCFLDYLKRKDFYSRSKKIFIPLITGEPI